MTDSTDRPAIDGIRSARVRQSRAVQHEQWRRAQRLKRLAIAAVVVIGVIGLLIPNVLRLTWQLAPFWRTGHYLVLLENNAELRPTGGFIGTYAVITIHHNSWFTTEVQTNIYKVDEAFTATHDVPPPDALRAVTDRWSLRDSNWAIDFPEASRTIAQFYHDETGDSVDGVIAVTAHVGQELVRLLGSVPLADGTQLTADNFYETLNYKIEKDYFLDPANRATNEPKVVIAQLIRSVAGRLLNPWTLNRSAKLLEQELATKHVLASFFDARRQQLIEAKGWAGRVDQSSTHYLSLNNANLGGQKSSVHMTQAVDLAITDDGTDAATYQLTVARTHHGTGDWPDHTNNNLLRVVLPADATLTTAALDGQPIEARPAESAAGRTAIGFQMDTEPGTTRTLVATFSVPLDRTLASTVTWQKQPGVVMDDVSIRYNGQPLIRGTLDRDITMILK